MLSDGLRPQIHCFNYTIAYSFKDAFSYFTFVVLLYNIHRFNYTIGYSFKDAFSYFTFVVLLYKLCLSDS